MVKMTFTVDEETAETLQRTARRLSRPQSAIVREAIREYAAHAGRLSEDERRRMLRSIDALISVPPDRSAADVSREIAAVRAVRRRGGRRSS